MQEQCAEDGGVLNGHGARYGCRAGGSEVARRCDERCKFNKKLHVCWSHDVSRDVFEG